MNLFLNTFLTAIAGTGASGSVDPAITSLLTAVVTGTLTIAGGVKAYRAVRAQKRRASR